MVVFGRLQRDREPIGEKGYCHPSYKANGTAFQCALEDAQLHDLGYKGPKFTWNNGRQGKEYTLERLDRAVANLEWCDMWKDAGVEVVVCCSSDHLPLLLSLTKREVRSKKWRPFSYEARWSKNGMQKKSLRRYGLLENLTRILGRALPGKFIGAGRP
jgi:hypothetical protein